MQTESTAVHGTFPPAEELMRSVLRDGDPIAAEYPLVFDGRFPGRIVVAEEEVGGERELRSACAILARELVVPGARLSVGFIGSVVTHPDHRGRGWGREVLARAEETLLADGCSVAMLWADDPGFYERLGYAAVGTELDYLVDPGLSAILPSMQRVREAGGDDVSALFRLYADKPARVERSAAEMAALLATPGMEVLVREDEAGEVCAYSCVGRGADFPSVVHEWAGSGEDVLATVQGHIQRRLELGDRDPLVIMVPTSDYLRSFFDLIETPFLPGVLGMARPLDPAALLDSIRPLLPDTVDTTVDATGAVTFSAPGGELTLERADLLTTLFEPKGARARVELLEDALGLTLRDLPVRPFIWGLDSI